MTFTEYLSYQPPPGFRDELIHGEVTLSPSAKIVHQDICKRIERVLENVLNPRRWIVQRDTTMFVNGEEGPRPDVFVILKERWLQGMNSEIGYPEGVPELVIEVRSPSDDDAEFEKKRAIYFSDARCQAFWVVDSERQAVHVFAPGQTQATVVSSGRRLRLPEILASTSDLEISDLCQHGV